jgi:anthranilate synthase/aminodeoxychorismate synthase-like glutamine amidotransferase
MILIIDNYDSFVYNLDCYLNELGCETAVVRNDEITVEEISQKKPAAIILSPGPCTPDEAGISVPLIQKYCRDIPILGVCLGHQCIANAFGGKIIRAEEAVHGRVSEIYHQEQFLFEGISSPFTATRYHSLIVDEVSLPEELTITARTDDGVPMSIQHSEFPLFGVQFHPESILTNYGHQLLANFLELACVPFTAIPERKNPEQDSGSQKGIAFEYPPRW